jgi:hypothetical protein
MYIPYAETAVPIKESKMEINELLEKHHAEGGSFSKEEGAILLKFSLESERRKHGYEIRVPIASFSQSLKRKARKKNRQKAAWRALYWTTKNELEKIQLKIKIKSNVVEYAENYGKAKNDVSHGSDK